MVTTENAFTSVAPIKAAAAAPTSTSPAVPTAAPAVPAAKAAPKAVPKQLGKKTASAAKTPARKPAKTATKVTAKPIVEVPAKSVANPVVKPVVKAAEKAKAKKPVKEKKPKLVRDSFTIPKDEYIVLDELKQRAGKLASPVKKSELLRAGVKALAAMSDSAFLAALKAVPAIKTGRPAKV